MTAQIFRHATMQCNAPREGHRAKSISQIYLTMKYYFHSTHHLSESVFFGKHRETSNSKIPLKFIALSFQKDLSSVKSNTIALLKKDQNQIHKPMNTSNQT